ncbi:hypothetical protein ACFC0K_15920 [Streptomyces hydrogenans]|uniref:Acb2/Tad1 domain-containing protein n=1 Tax=Streptomyces hydrogenans TaxID=1873719 RepID=UPI0035DDB4E6
MSLPLEEIDRRFGYHPADTPERVAEHGEVRSACRTLALVLNELPPGRESALAMTLCEQSMFWANAALARAERKPN